MNIFRKKRKFEEDIETLHLKTDLETEVRQSKISELEDILSDHKTSNDVSIESLQNRYLLVDATLNSLQTQVTQNETDLKEVSRGGILGTIVYRRLNLEKNYDSFLTFASDSGQAHSSWPGRFFVSTPIVLSEFILSLDPEGFDSWSSGQIYIVIYKENHFADGDGGTQVKLCIVQRSDILLCNGGKAADNMTTANNGYYSLPLSIPIEAGYNIQLKVNTTDANGLSGGESLFILKYKDSASQGGILIGPGLKV